MKKLTVAVKYNEPLKNYTTFKIGGPVRAMYFPEDAAGFMQLYDTLCAQGARPFIMGNGTNILADDRELDIDVINTSMMKSIELQGTVLTASSGVSLPELASFACKHSLTGLEFAHGIPGTLGGAVMMNAGAYGSEMKDAVHETQAYSPAKGAYTVTGDGHEFSYRYSVFARSGEAVISCVLHLKKGERTAIEQKMEELAARRRGSQPLDMPSAGSTFKRPASGYAAALIEQAGLKGYTIGGAQVSMKHAGFIVNKGDATFADVMALIRHVQDTVGRRMGVHLEPEVKIWK